MYSYVIALMLAAQTDDYGGYLIPIEAPPCICQSAGDSECTCADGCTCHPATVAKPALHSVLKPVARAERIDAQSPPTLAPDPDYEAAMAAFTERHKDGKPKVWVVEKLTETPAATTRANASGPPVSAARPPAYQPKPVEQAAMVQVQVCGPNGCQTVWRPASSVTKPVPQPVQQRTFRRGRGVQLNRVSAPGI